MDRESFLHVLQIARLRLTEEEIEEFLKQFEEIFSLMERVKTIEFSESDEEVVENPLREDRAEKPGEDVTSVFPVKKDRYLEVPKNL